MSNRDELCTMVGKRIREVRKTLGMTVEQLAEAAEISTQYVSEIEHGKKSMTLFVIKNMAKALNISYEYLIDGKTMVDPICDLAAQHLAAMTPIDRDLTAHTLLNALKVIENLGREEE